MTLNRMPIVDVLAKNMTMKWKNMKKKSGTFTKILILDHSRWVFSSFILANKFLSRES